MSTTTFQNMSSPITSTAETGLSLLKVFAGIFLALSAFLGSLVPELLMRSYGNAQFQHVILPIGNALSAGLLFGAGMLHFFSEGTAALAAISLTSKLTAAAHEAQVELHSSSSSQQQQHHKSSHENLIHVATHSGFSTAAPAMMLGYLLSLVIDRVVLEQIKRTQKLPQWLNHGHSHGGGHSHEHGSDEEHQHQRSEEGGGAAVISVSNATKEQQQQQQQQQGASPSSPSHPQAQQGGSAQLANAASVLTIAVLMSLHSAIEGVTLALETSATTLRGAFIPLFIHRFFDGVVVGFQASAVSSSSSSSSAGAENGTGGGRVGCCSELMRVVFRKTTLILLGWSVITPIVLILVLLTSSTASDNNGGGAAAAAASTQSFAGAWAQCFAAGSFVYISGELLNEVFSRQAAMMGRAAVSSGSSSSPASDADSSCVTRMFGPLGSRVLGLVAGVSIVLLLEAMDSE